MYAPPTYGDVTPSVADYGDNVTLPLVELDPWANLDAAERARFITKVIEHHVRAHDPKLPYYTPPPAVARQRPAASLVGCFASARMTSRPGGGFVESKTRRMLRRYSVAACETACWEKGTEAFALQCGGFCSGNGHKLGRCFCGPAFVAAVAMVKRLPPKVCETTCSLHDPRPCGGYDGLAVYNLDLSNETKQAGLETDIDASAVTV